MLQFLEFAVSVESVSTSDPVAAAKAELGVRTRLDGPTAPSTLDARRALAAAVLERRVKEIVDAAPPLTAAQRDRIVRALG